MWEPRRLTTLWASTVYYRDNFTFISPYFEPDYPTSALTVTGLERVLLYEGKPISKLQMDIEFEQIRVLI
jgi:hypothetical protein